MPFEWEQITKRPDQPAAEILKAHQLTREFHQEVEYREDFNQYCQWYYETAERHHRELEKMRKDINILGWFLGRIKN